MTTSQEYFKRLGHRIITRCDRCNRANGWGVVTHRVLNPVNNVESDYCTHCLIVRSGDKCMIEDCIIEECYERNRKYEDTRSDDCICREDHIDINCPECY